MNINVVIITFSWYNESSSPPFFLNLLWTTDTQQITYIVLENLHLFSFIASYFLLRALEKEEFLLTETRVNLPERAVF